MLSERCRYFGFGIMPCWRGPALYDDPASKAAITKWVAFYKKHRAILTSDIIHLRRADHQVRDRYGLSVLYCTVLGPTPRSFVLGLVFHDTYIDMQSGVSNNH